jgi:regulatory protein
MKQSEALSRAAALCSRTEYCERQIREKLQKWEVEPSECDTIINRLYEEKFLDTNRYCHAFCSDKFRQNHWGRLKIKQALVMQGLPSPDIQEALADLDSQEYRNALRHILMQKNKTIKDTDPYTRKVKLARHALSKGFENHLIIPLIEEEF